MEFADALDRVLHGRFGDPTIDFAAWWVREESLRKEVADPTARAVVLAATSGRLGLAFAGGFRAALVRLTGDLDPVGARRLAFCATEAGGAHPRAITTRLQAEGATLRLRGEKKWATLGDWADELLVVCRRGEQADGRPLLALVRVDVPQPGVSRLPAQATPFCPEITHCGFEFDLALAEDRVLPGDGYADYLKPFRTVEDSYVQLVVCAYLLGVSRRLGLGAEWQELWSAAALTAWTLTTLDPRQPGTHTALAGAEELLQGRRAAFEAVWEAASGDEWTAWERDRGLLRVAQQARDARRAAARRLLC